MGIVFSQKGLRMRAVEITGIILQPNRKAVLKNILRAQSDKKVQ